jgi:hypothetical protein
LSDPIADKAYLVTVGLLAQKNYEDYLCFFFHLKRICPKWRPKEMMFDFEQGLHQAFLAIYPDARVRGCFFHLYDS